MQDELWDPGTKNNELIDQALTLGQAQTGVFIRKTRHIRDAFIPAQEPAVAPQYLPSPRVLPHLTDENFGTESRCVAGSSWGLNPGHCPFNSPHGLLPGRKGPGRSLVHSKGSELEVGE